MKTENINFHNYLNWFNLKGKENIFFISEKFILCRNSSLYWKVEMSRSNFQQDEIFFQFLFIKFFKYVSLLSLAVCTPHIIRIFKHKVYFRMKNMQQNNMFLHYYTDFFWNKTKKLSFFFYETQYNAIKIVGIGSRK